MKRLSKFFPQVIVLLLLTCFADGAGLAQIFQGVPLIDFKSGDLYLGKFQGLLYNASNIVPSTHEADGLGFLSKIQPLDVDGKPSATGKIVVLGFGMSNWTSELCQAMPAINRSGSTIRTWEQYCDPNSFMGQAYQNVGVDKDHLVIIDCARGGQTTIRWVNDSFGNYGDCRDSWLTPFGLSEAQVQVVLWKNADANPLMSGYSSLSASTNCSPETKVEACHYEYLLGLVVRYWKTRYLNLQQAFLHSRIYAGHATVQLNPEPYAYEYGFATKWFIQAQINQVSTGSVDSTAGDLSYKAAPWLAWGPYFWASDDTPRSDGLAWVRTDFGFDGTHPSPSGVEKVAGVVNHIIEPYGMLTFYLQSIFTPWFRLL